MDNLRIPGQVADSDEAQHLKTSQGHDPASMTREEFQKWKELEDDKSRSALQTVDRGIQSLYHVRTLFKSDMKLYSLTEVVGPLGLSEPLATNEEIRGEAALESQKQQFSQSSAAYKLRAILRQELASIMAEQNSTGGLATISESEVDDHDDERCAEMLFMTQSACSQDVEPSVPKHTRLIDYRTIESRIGWEQSADMQSIQGSESETASLEESVEITLPLFFGGFSRKNWIRYVCFRIYSSTVGGAFFGLVNCISCLAIIIVPEIDSHAFNVGIGSSKANDDSTKSMVIAIFLASDILQLFCIMVLLFEIVVGTIAVGFIQGPSTWLRISYFNKIDFFVAILSVLGFLLSIFFNGNAVSWVRTLRLLRILRPISNIDACIEVKRIFLTLGKCASNLASLLLMLLFFILCFAVFGMAILKGSFRRRCVTASRNISSCATFFSGNRSWWSTDSCRFDSFDRAVSVQGGDVVVAGGYPFFSMCKIFANSTPGQYDGMYPLDEDGKYHSCQLDRFLAGHAVDQKCADVGNPGFGFQHFDNLFGALLVLFQFSIPDGANGPLHFALQSEPAAVALIWIYFITVTCINTFIMLSVFLAVITGTFQKVGLHLKLSDLRAPLERRPATKKAEEPAKLISIYEQGIDGRGMFRMVTKYIIRRRYYNYGITATIILHLFAMSVSETEFGDSLGSFIPITYLSATLVFVCDLFLQFIASEDSTDFLHSTNTRMEMLLIVCGAAGLLSGLDLLSVIPCIRLFRLAIHFPTLYDLLQHALSAAGPVVNLIMFTTMLSCCFASIGRYNFRGDMDNLTRANYGSFVHSMLTTFHLLTGDSWSSILYCAVASQSALTAQLYAATYIIIWIITGKIIIFDLFITMAVQNFNVKDSARLIQEPGQIAAFLSRIEASVNEFVNTITSMRNLKEPEEGLDAEEVHDPDDEQSKEKKRSKKKKKKKQHVISDGKYVFSTAKARHARSSISGEEEIPISPRSWLEKVRFNSTKSLLLAALPIPGSNLEAIENTLGVKKGERTLFFLLPTSPLRQVIAIVINSFVFNILLYCSILLSSFSLITLQASSDLPGQGPPIIPPWLMYYFDLGVNAMFSVELILRIASQGLIFTTNAYLRSAWHTFDFLVLCLAWLDFAARQTNLIIPRTDIYKIFRLAWVLRPLRMLKFNPSLQAMMEALSSTLTPAVYVCGCALLACIIFAIFGKALFGGKMYFCTVDITHPGGKGDCAGAYVEQSAGILLPRAWIIPTYNFDGLVQGILTMFRINTIKYIDIFYAGIDVTEKHKSPSRGFAEFHSLFFIFYLLFVGFFIMNIFLTFIIHSFNMKRHSVEPVDLIYKRYLRQIQSNCPRVRWFRWPQTIVSKKTREIVGSRAFQTFSISCVVINVSFMLADHADQSDFFSSVLELQNFIFFIELIVEVSLQYIAYGAGGFIDDAWRSFDVVVLIGTGAGYISGSKLEVVAKAFRILRIIRLMRMIKSIRVLLETIFDTIPEFANIMIMIILVFTMFATLFVQNLGVLKFGKRIGPTANFESFPAAFSTCYQIIVRDDWMDLMDDAGVQWPYCTPRFDSTYLYGYTGPQYSFGDCGSTFTLVYFVVFKLICEYMLLNLVTGVILDKFSFVTDSIGQTKDPAWKDGANVEQIEDLVQIFEKYAAGSLYVAVPTAITSLLFEFPIPLGFRIGHRHREHEYESMERAARRLMRAELNIILRSEMAENRRLEHEAKHWTQRWKLYLSGILKRRTQKYVNGIKFQECLMVLLYWRKPSLTPQWLKTKRIKLVEEAYMMSSALIIMDFLRGLVAKRKCKEMRQQVRDLYLLRRWMRRDHHRIRMTQHYNTVRQKMVERANQPTKAQLTTSPCAASIVVAANPIDISDQELFLHHSSVHFAINDLEDASAEVVIPRPAQGLEVFRKRAAEQLVVMHFVDPVHVGRNRVICDFRHCAWAGWQITNLMYDTIMNPRRTHDVGAEPAKWLEVELVWTNDADKPIEWVILDVQSFIERRQESPQSVIRINLGLKASAGQDVPGEMREFDLDGVAEVTGYMSV